MSMSCRTPPKRLRFAFWAFDPVIMRMNDVLNEHEVIMRMNDVLNEHELQDTPGEAPLRFVGF